ncbi:MAG: hypothetical protein NTX65_02125 [Ignavibacteriales bacterium]|nr:hypothetical protein [Ignavibacteriales bacterium]
MGIINDFIHRATNGQKEDIDYLMSHLTKDSTIAMTRFIDYALGFVKNQQGINQMEFYLFNGTLMQRNYCCLYFNRKGDWQIVKRAFKSGLIDEIQAYSR